MLRRILVLLLFASGISLSAQTVYTWQGSPVPLGFAQAGDLYQVGTNWVGGTVPPNSSTLTDIVFGGSPPHPLIEMPIGATTVRAVTFSNPGTDLMLTFFGGNYGGSTLAIGAGGITASGSGSRYVDFGFGLNVQLLANQTWTTDVNVSVYGEITGGFSITKAGTGYLVLNGVSTMSTFSGGVNVSQGKLLVAGNSSATLGVVDFGPVGTGTLTLQNGTTLANAYQSVTLDNNIVFQGSVALGMAANAKTDQLSLLGGMLLGTPAVTLGSLNRAGVNLTGNISQPAGVPSSLTLTGPGLIRLGGQNTYTGGTTVSGSAVIFAQNLSLPATGSIATVGTDNYLGVAEVGGMTLLLGKISSPALFGGALGFETTPPSAPVNFTDAINLSAFDFSTFKGLGSFSKAILSGTITIPSGQNYKFGGGHGSLYVSSNLGPVGTAGLNVAPATVDDAVRLSVFLQGTNTFTGGISVRASSLIFDSAGALPAAAAFTLAQDGYVGYTENATGVASFANFVGHLSPGNYGNRSIIGFDSADVVANLRAPGSVPTPVVRTISSQVDLSGLDQIFLGTATKVIISGSIKPPNTGAAAGSGELYLTGVNGGFMSVTSPLAFANGVTGGLKVGLADLGPGFTGHRGYVELTSGATDFPGNTTLSSGYLLLGNSSTFALGNVTSGPIGKGTLVVPLNSDKPALAASVSAVTLHNNISILGGSLTIGVPYTNAPNEFSSPLQGMAAYGLTLNGVISGTGAIGYYALGGTLTLGGNNSGFSGGFSVNPNATITVNHNNALGTGSLAVSDGTVIFNTAAPAIGSLTGDMGTISLASGSTLTINQTQDQDFGGSIYGSTATIVKNGTGTLYLYGSSSTFGSLTINSGTVKVGADSVVDGVILSGAVGIGTITINGGRLDNFGHTVDNLITFGPGGGKLSGNGSYSAPMTIGANITLSPGNSPGAMSFSSGLTWATGGSYDFEILSATSVMPGIGYDTVVVSGAPLTITATSLGTFRLNLLSLNPMEMPGNVADFNPTLPYQWTLATSAAGFVGFAANAFTLDTSGFTNSLNGGFFSLSANSNLLYLNFTPVPEPSTWALLAVGLGAMGWRAFRRRQRD